MQMELMTGLETYGLFHLHGKESAVGSFGLMYLPTMSAHTHLHVTSERLTQAVVGQMHVPRIILFLKLSNLVFAQGTDDRVVRAIPWVVHEACCCELLISMVLLIAACWADGRS